MGWLDKLENGGKFDGLTTKGRNYSPAWGGQFQNGGFLQPDSDKLPEGYVIPRDTPSSELAQSIGGEDGEPAYLIPTFKHGKPLYDPVEEFNRTGEHLGGPFKTWQEADAWEQSVRHPKVERKEKIQFPIKEFQYGGSTAGSVGGANPGSVGFTYARLGAPSNGKRGKKTVASAQDGKDIHGSDIVMKSKNALDVTRTHYDPRTNTAMLGSDYEAMSPEEKLRTLTHENRHAWQVNNKRTNFGVTHTPEAYNLWDRMQKEPQGPVTGENYWNYHDRKARETDIDVDRFKRTRPGAALLPYAVVAQKYADPYQYGDPGSLEGEAEYYTQTGKQAYAHGGIIQDNRGYWNPDNWGKPVEIGGTDITMRGVNQPLLGVSDTGDKKLMKPGKNYKFKGSKVTELPVGKNGKELTKLDQLTNFTNYNTPQPGGWLDNL